jgi:hypothetical protein
LPQRFLTGSKNEKSRPFAAKIMELFVKWRIFGKTRLWQAIFSATHACKSYRKHSFSPGKEKALFGSFFAIGAAC